MTELGLFGLEIFLVMWVRLGSNWNLLDHLETVTFQPDHFFRIVGQESELSHAEIEKNLRAKSVISQVGRKSQLRVRFHSIESFFLQFISVDFGRQADPATFLAHVNQNAVARFGNLSQRRVQLLPAIASA